MSEADQTRQDNFAVYERMLHAQNSKDRETFLACLADDIIFEAPAYSKTGKPIAEGSIAMGNMFNTLTEMFVSMNYQLKRFIPAVDPNLVIAEVKGDNEVGANKKRYQNNYIFLVTCRGGKIAHILEYSNPSVLSDSIGPA